MSPVNRPLKQPGTLTGSHVVLEPLHPQHVGSLVAAASVDRSSYAFTAVPDGHDAMTGYVDGLVAGAHDGVVVPFVQRLAGDPSTPGRIVGCTRFMELRRWRPTGDPDEVEIGGTWLAADAQRTPVNTEAKLLLLTYAFDEWGVWRVAFVTDARNERSRAAIGRLGTTFEGVLRHHRPTSDSGGRLPRNSAVYSIISHDWPVVRNRLHELLGARR